MSNVRTLQSLVDRLTGGALKLTVGRTNAAPEFCGEQQLRFGWVLVYDRG